MQCRVFIVHANEDVAFVRGYLVHALGIPTNEVALSSALAPGSLIVDEIASGACSAVVILVLSPAFVTSPWTSFAQKLALHRNVETGTGLVIPLLLADCVLSVLGSFRTPLDFRDRDAARWEAEEVRLREVLGTTRPDAPDIACPYPGARPFATSEAELLCARGGDLHLVLEPLRRGEREVHVIGAPGAGKTSLITAGLVPRIEAPHAGDDRYQVCTMRPGADPVGELAKALRSARLAQATDDALAGALASAVDERLREETPRLLLIVDQLEELFTVASRSACRRFASLIAALRRDARVALILITRTASYDQLLESSLWPSHSVAPTRIEPLRGDALREAITRPASRRDVYVEPSLVEQLVHDAARDPRPLPWLQAQLCARWAQRRYHLLCLPAAPTGRDASPEASAFTGGAYIDNHAQVHEVMPVEPTGIGAWLRATADWWICILALVAILLYSALASS